MELPDIISHYLNLNLTFVKPTNDFDGTLGWQNETYSSGPLEMINKNEVDFIINDVITTKNIWNPKLYQMSTALFDDYTINFVLKKHIIKTSISDYFKVFSLLTWILILLSIILVSVIQTIISLKKFDHLFCLKLSVDYFKMLISKSSRFLTKLTDRHYLMYFIPILSVLLIALFQNIIYLNMIIPQKHWCQDIDCFAKSKLNFYTVSDEPALIAMREKKEWQFKEILSRLTIGKPRGNYNLYL